MNNDQMYVVRVTDEARNYSFLHAGGRGNGAVAGLYGIKGVNRVMGRYKKSPHLKAEAIPVVIGKTIDQESKDMDKLEWLGYLERAGVDNWQGIDEAFRMKEEDEVDCNGE